MPSSCILAWVLVALQFDESPIPLSHTAFCQPKQVQLCIKNVKLKIISQAMSNCCVYTAISASNHYHQTKSSLFRAIMSSLLARSWEPGSYSYLFNKNCNRRRTLPKLRTAELWNRETQVFKVRRESFSFISHIPQATEQPWICTCLDYSGAFIQQTALTEDFPQQRTHHNPHCIAPVAHWLLPCL